MKKLLTICLLTLTVCAVAQNKKIALLEPRAGEGTVVSGMEKAMVRGELRKAIVNHTGYEAFTRSDIDQLMNEQGFQRTGNVSDEDIHKLGEMSGADYICVSTLNKSNTEFYLEAYLIDIESGAISNPASQFGELVEGKLSNMLPVCQSLAQELLGTANPVVTSTKSRQSQQQTTQAPKSAPAVSVAPVAQLSSNDIITFEDGSKGVVFYRDDKGHGLVVSLDEQELQWQNVPNKKSIRDILSIPNGSCGFVPGLGEENTQKIISELGEANAPAAQWCIQHGRGWYLPSAGELVYLLSAANGANASQGQISTLLMMAGGMPLTKYYWASNEEDEKNAYNISPRGNSPSEYKNEKVAVRAMRRF